MKKGIKIMENTTKMTKKEIYTQLLAEEVVANNPIYKELIEKQIASGSKSKATMTTESVEAVLSSVPKTIAEIAAAAELTERQTVSRLSKLVASNVAYKEQVNVDGRKVMAYALRTTENVEA
jgi:transcription initiation factor TFIIIB Brf1 subunit/transcription initiation factor TFIIB